MTIQMISLAIQSDLKYYEIQQPYYYYLLMSIKQIDDYQIYISKKLRKDFYGEVYLGKKMTTNEEVSIRIIPKNNINCEEQLMEAFKKEIQILQKIHSENMVAFYDYKESNNNYYIIEQLCDSDLTKLIKPGVCYPQTEAIQMLRQICSGFLALIFEGIIHRDLRPANILIKGKTLKISGFGLSKQLSDVSQMMNSSTGTIMYSSWEMLKRQRYTSKCDIWALGIIFYELLHGTKPWNAKEVYQLLQFIESKPLTITRQDLSKDTTDFLQRCLKLKEADRISWNQVFAHPIFKGYFIQKATSAVFQNKMKMIMAKLKLEINRKDLNLKQLMNSLLFNQSNGQIHFKDFFIFLYTVYPKITHEQADYCFRVTDTDNNGIISITQLNNMLLNHGIKMEVQLQVIPSIEKSYGVEEPQKLISAQASKKIKSCFKKLLKIVVIKKITLQQVFDECSNKKCFLTLEQFYTFIKKLCGSTIQISDEEIKYGFKLLDKNDSNSINFQEFNYYYTKANGISQLPSMPPLNRPKINIYEPSTAKKSNSNSPSDLLKLIQKNL